MPVKVAISGFGRIGRNVLRAIAESGRDDIALYTGNDDAIVVFERVCEVPHPKRFDMKSLNFVRRIDGHHHDFGPVLGAPREVVRQVSDGEHRAPSNELGRAEDEHEVSLGRDEVVNHQRSIERDAAERAKQDREKEKRPA